MFNLKSRPLCTCQYSTKYKQNGYGITRTDGYNYWFKHKSMLSDRWQDFKIWKSECWDHRNGRYLRSIIDDKLLDIDNFRWTNVTAKSIQTKSKVTEILIKRGATKEEAEDRIGKISRQRIHQIIDASRAWRKAVAIESVDTAKHIKISDIAQKINVSYQTTYRNLKKICKISNIIDRTTGARHSYILLKDYNKLKLTPSPGYVRIYKNMRCKIYRLIKEGIIPSEKIFGAVYVDQNDLKNYQE